MTTHGCNKRSGKTPEYRAWDNMIARCERPRHDSFKNYGAVGIKICKRWRDSFTEFLKDMGPKPSPLHSLDRIDSANNYFPENCKWSTRHEQNCNRKPHRKNKKGRFSKGVTFHRDWFEARLTVLGTGKQRYLGIYRTEKEAIDAVREEACRQNA